MPFKYTYEEILAMVRRNVLDVNVARAIVRRAGLRPGGASAGHTPILSVCPPGGPCPRAPYPPYTWSMANEARDAYYNTVADAESGDPAALEDMRQYLIDFGLESELVIDGVMPILGYDYSGEVYTYQLDTDNGCIIEVDIAPPAAGFWEQYKGGDSRFTDTGTFLLSDQNLKFLLKSFTLHTGPAEYDYPLFLINVGHGYPECDFGDGRRFTHYNDVIMFANTLQTLSVVGYWWNTQSSTIQPPSPMEIWLTSAHNLSNPVSPTVETTSLGNGPLRTATLAGLETRLHPPYTGSGAVNMPQRYDTAIYGAESTWRACADAPETFPDTIDHFIAIQSFQPADQSFITDTSTYEQVHVTKKDLGSTQTIDWTDNPPAGESKLRYDNTWPTFDVVAVRTYQDDSVSAGTHFFPSDLQDYITKWDISKATQVRMTAVVEEATAAGATISPIWATSAADIRFQNWSYLGTGISPTSSGFYATEWEDLPAEAREAEDIYVAFILEVDDTIEVLQFGLAEVHIR